MSASRQPVRLEAILAFAFGCVFCGILAYAGLRKEPITDPGQFFLLRVLSAIAAAGIAAVIPGMLDIKIGQGKLLAVRGAGALGVFLIVYWQNPPELVRPASDAKRAAMEGNYAQGLYQDANRIADEILKTDPNDAQALNIKGGISFYNRDYEIAQEYFRRAYLSHPKDVTIASNYANCLIETGAYHSAIDIFKTIDDGKRDRLFSLGRAYLYASVPIEAQKYLERVPTNYWHGAARILEASALVKIAESADGQQSKSLMQKAESKFNDGYGVDPNYWDGIFSGKVPDKHQSYLLPVSILKIFYKPRIATN